MPVSFGLGIVALAAAPDELAARVAFAQNAPPRNARADGSGAADDQYNYISGLFDKGFHDLVVTESRKFLASHANHARVPLVRYRLGQALFELKKLAEARTELAKLEPAPRDFQYAVEVSFRLGQCALELGETAEAARRFDAIAAAAGDAGAGSDAAHYLAPAAAFYAGEAHFRANEFAAAARAYGKAVQGGDAEYARSALYGLGWALYKAGEFDSAGTTFELFVRKHGQDPAAAETQFLLGECRMKQGRPGDALAAFQKVPPGDWQDDALSAAGFACAALNDPAKAAQWFLRVEQAAPESPLLPEARLHAGIHLQKAGRDDDSAAVLDRLLAESGGAGGAGFTSEACYWRGLVERRRGGPKAAVAFFDRGLAGKPEKGLAQRLALARADALFDAGDFDAAKDAYASAGGSSEDAAYSSAVAALNGGDFAGAAQRARDFLARYGKGKRAGAANLVLGEALFAQGEGGYAGALAAFDEAAREEKDQKGQAGQEPATAIRPRALSRAGWCCFRLGRFADASQRFATLVKEFPEDERAPEAAFMAGRSALRGGDAKGGEAALAHFLQKYGSGGTGEWSDDARYDLAQCKRLLGKGEDAEDLLAQLAQGGAKVDASVARRAALESAEIDAAAGRHEDALAALASVVGRANGSPQGGGGEVPSEVLRPALYAQAWSLFSLDRFDEASAALARLLASEKPNAPLASEIAVPALELQVSIARARKDGAGARAAYDRLAKLAPEGERTPESALVAALALDESGDPRAAAGVLEDASRRWPRFSGRDRVLYQWSLSLQKAGDGEKAKVVLARIAAEAADSPLAAKAAFDLGEKAYEAGDYDGALASYRKAAVDGSAVADAALYKSAWCEFQRQRFEQAAEQFAQVAARFEKSPLAGESRYLAGESLYRAGRLEPAADALAEFLRQHPKHEQRAKGLFRLGVACGELTRTEESLDALTKLSREFPEFELRTEADLWLGRALLAKKRTNDALARFDAVIQADRGVLAARAHLGRGDVLLAQQKLDDALGEYLKVSLLFSSEPEVARALWQAGQCLEQMGDRDKAKARYRELIERHPKTPEAAPARARLKDLETKSF